VNERSFVEAFDLLPAATSQDILNFLRSV